MADNYLAKFLQDPKFVQREGEGNYLRQQFPKLYGALGGLLGTAPDEMQGSVLDPLTAQVKQGAEMGYLPGLIASSAPPIKGGTGLAALAGMFVGKGSKTWDALQAAKALQLEKAGVDARKIWSETGTWKGPDGAWRQEIPDNTAALTAGNISHEQMRAVNGGDWIKENDFLAKHYQTPEAKAIRTRASMRNGGVLNDDTPKLFDTLSHNKLADSYPQLGDIRVALDDKMPIGNAAYAAGNNAIVMSPMKDADALGAKLHEVQHAIQGKEGWALGGAPGSNGLTWDELSANARSIYEGSQATHGDPLLAELFGDAPALKPWDSLSKPARIPWYEQAQTHSYKNLAGEAEARATEARMLLDAAQRRALFPADSYDVPLDQLILRGQSVNQLQKLLK